jgi:rare lipoprotein A (peptidoglycan hydrolase)
VTYISNGIHKNEIAGFLTVWHKSCTQHTGETFGGDVRSKTEDLPIVVVWVVLLSLFAFPARVFGGQLQGLQPVRTAQQQKSEPQTPAQQKQTFEGRITRSGGRLVLEDNSVRLSYQLDDQQLAVFFEGREVKLTGTLDPKTNTISLSDVGVSNAKHAAKKAAPRHKLATQTRYGMASWYQRSNRHPRTASGERFDDRALTAAHPRLPLGSRVRVTNLRNGRSVLVRVNDRGPFIPGRVIDLSKGAAQQLGFVHEGLAYVRISVISFPS